MGHFHKYNVYSMRTETVFDADLDGLVKTKKVKGDVAGVCVGSVFPTKSNDFVEGGDYGVGLVMGPRSDGTLYMSMFELGNYSYERLYYDDVIKNYLEGRTFVHIENLPQSKRVEALGTIPMEVGNGMEKDVVVVSYESDMYRYLDNKEVTSDVLSMSLKEKLDLFVKEEQVEEGVSDLLYEYVLGEKKVIPVK